MTLLLELILERGSLAVPSSQDLTLTISTMSTIILDQKVARRPLRLLNSKKRRKKNTTMRKSSRRRPSSDLLHLGAKQQLISTWIELWIVVLRLLIEWM